MGPQPVAPVEEWTYGCEHELGDWDRSRGLPPGFGIDEADFTMVNTNGIAVDPKGRLYPFGGEALTPPTSSPAGQAIQLGLFLRLHPEAVVNHRSNLHVHVKVPGLRHHLPALKLLAHVGRYDLREVINLVEPIPQPRREDYTAEEFEGALRRYRRRCVSHHTIVTEERLQAQMEATTVEEFFECEVPRSAKGAPQWQLAPRHAVNLRHLREDVETVEFRHFPGTLSCGEVETCVAWCRDYLLVALGHHPRFRTVWELWDRQYRRETFPTFPAYHHARELRYRATCHDGSLPREQIRRNIEIITTLGPELTYAELERLAQGKVASP